MVTILRRAVALLALAVGIGVAAGAAPAAAATTHNIRSGAQHITITRPIHSAGPIRTADDWWF